jgi:hypothetical protein
VREIEDETGKAWMVGVKARLGRDFKGRYVFAARPVGEDGAAEVYLDDVRWNSEKTALRTLRTMSVVELRRRLRWARGRVTTAP